MRKLVPLVLLLICLGMMVLLHWLWPLRIVWPYPYNRLGIVPVAGGLLMVCLGIGQFRKARTNLLPFREADRLVTEGPYRLTRNPMYLGMALVLVGSWMLLGTLSSLLGVLVFVLVADRWYIRSEEQMLQRQFGPAFEAYKARTRRWV